MRVRNPEDDRGGGIGTREGSEKSDGTRTVDLMGAKGGLASTLTFKKKKFFSNYSN
jgi:hypothetical protein